MTRWPAVRRVDRLVAEVVLGSVGLVWVTIVGFDAFMNFIGEVNDVVQGNYTLTKAIVVVLLTVPRRFHEMFGYAALVGSLLGLGGLAASGELTALRAAGMSKLRICASALCALAALTVLVTVMGETVAPAGERKSQAVELAAKSKVVALARGGSLWARDGDAVVNARSGRTRGAEVDLSGVRVFEFDPEGRLTALSVADRAVHAHGAWTLFDVHRTVFGVDSAQGSDHKQLDWASGLDPQMLAISIIRPQYMPLRDLDRNIAYLDKNRQDASTFVNAWWTRVFYPLNVLVLAFFAVPFAFGTLRSGGLSKRLFIGMVLAIGFYFAQRAVVSMGLVYGFGPAVANLIPPLVLLAGIAFYFRRHA